MGPGSGVHKNRRFLTAAQYDNPGYYTRLTLAVSPIYSKTVGPNSLRPQAAAGTGQPSDFRPQFFISTI